MQTVYPFGVSSTPSVGEPVITTLLGVLAGATTSVSVGAAVAVIFMPNKFMTQAELDIENTFLNTDEFAQSISYTFSNGYTQIIKAIYDNEYLSVQGNAEIGVMSSDPYIIIQSSKLKYHPQSGDTVNIGGKIYKVYRPEPDGTGITVIYLHRNTGE